MARHLAKLVFTNVTPLWTGGPLGGATYNIIGDKVIGPWLPDAKSIIGRTRWLLRAAEASAQARLGRAPSSMKDVDTIASRIFGDTGHASKIIIRVHATPNHDLLPQNGCKGCYLHFKAYTDLKSLESRKVDIITGLEEDAFTNLRARLGVDSKVLLKGKARKRYHNYKYMLQKLDISIPESILKLMEIPRVRLLAQGKESARRLFENQPLPPGAVQLSVDIYERASSSLNPGEAQLATVAIAYALAFLGIGKATSRGFGRFFLEEIATSGPVEEVSGILDWFSKSKLGKPHNAGNVFKGTGRWIVEQACRLLGLSQQCPSMPQQPALLRVPSLDVAISRARVVEGVKHPCPYALLELAARNKPGCCHGRRPVAEIHDALSAVGRASMKVMWKLCSGKDVNEPGTNYHTWVLGLPRQGKARVCGREVVTGYQVAECDLWALEENCHTCGVEGEFREVRRASPVAVTTYCGGGGCYALLEPFATLNDFVDLLIGTQNLVHIGVHGLKSYNPLVHVAGVYKIAISPRLGSNNCPQDEGGVKYPPSANAKRRPRDAKEVVVEALNASIEWLMFLLN